MHTVNTEACLFVIFGATGDLMHRKLLPALYQLMNDGLLPARCHVLGVGRDTGLTDERFREQARTALREAGLPAAGAIRRWCDTCVGYQGLGAGGAADYARLAARMTELERRRRLPGNRVLLPRAAARGRSGERSTRWGTPASIAAAAGRGS